MHGLRRPCDHATTGARARDVGQRQYFEVRDGRWKADAAVRVRRASPIGRRSNSARQFDGAVAIATDHAILYLEDQRAGSRYSGIPRTGAARIASGGYAQAGRHVEGGYHAYEARLSSQQRSAVQRQRGAHGVLRYPRGWRPGIHGCHIHRGRSAISLRAVGGEQSFSPRGRWIEMGPTTLRTDSAFEVNRYTGIRLEGAPHGIQ